MLFALMDKTRPDGEGARPSRARGPGYRKRASVEATRRQAPDGRAARAERYYRLTSPLVGAMIEAMASVAGEATPPVRGLSRVDETMATARTCYDHLAGRLAVAVADVLQKSR